jgi:ABC-type nitrate/sulfonate/bicarbonate transport system substrate-binding protein
MGRKTPLKFALLALAATPLLAGGALAADKVTIGVIPITDVAPIYLGVA